MNKKLYHIEFKNALDNDKHFYYGDLTILCKNQEIPRNILTTYSIRFDKE